MEFKAEIKKTFTGPDKLRAVCSVVLDDCFLVKNVRVVEGEKGDRKSTRLNSSHRSQSRMPSSA